MKRRRHSDDWYRQQFPCPPDPDYKPDHEPDLVELFQGEVGKDDDEDDED